MGGLVFVIVMVAALAVVRDALFIDLIFLVVLCAGIGAVDDVLKIRHGVNRGLPARTKLLATALAATIFLRAIDAGQTPYNGVVFHAGTYFIGVPHWLWLLLGILAITGTIHAVNLTDGLDGLAAGVMIPPLALLGFLAVAMEVPAVAVGSAAGVGACAAFLIFNRHPAKLFMGDTGSLALGALLAGAAILTGEMLLLLLIGGVFVAEALSVILQVFYFKTYRWTSHIPDEPPASSLRAKRLAGDEGDDSLLACIDSLFRAWMGHRPMSDTFAFGAGETILIIGLGRSGLASIEVLSEHRVVLYATDEKPLPELAKTITVAQSLGARFIEPAEIGSIVGELTCAVLSPGVPPTSPVVRRLHEANVPVFGEIELAYRLCNAPIVAVTGTKGKSTTTALIGHLLRGCGLQVRSRREHRQSADQRGARGRSERLGRRGSFIISA